jgi:hypothetical protein
MTDFDVDNFIEELKENGCGCAKCENFPECILAAIERWYEYD